MAENQQNPEEEHPLVRKQEATAITMLLLRWRAYQSTAIAAIIIGLAFAMFGIHAFGGFAVIAGGVIIGSVGIMRARYESRVKRFVDRYHVTPGETLSHD